MLKITIKYRNQNTGWYWHDKTCYAKSVMDAVNILRKDITAHGDYEVSIVEKA